jgi:M3 family oligoendopeptidase
MSLTPGILKVDEELTQAGTLFGRLHPRLAGHFNHMVKNGYIDLENRPNKRSGAFATSYDDEKKAVIFCNNTGNADDIGTLTHEMGHAFQAWESMWIEPVELRWPTYEACEIHSTGMEYLALPLLDTFLSPEDAAKYRKLRLIDTLTMLPYIATVDEFQHWVYEHPNHSAAEREAAWSRIWDTYNVGVDFSGYEDIKATRWMRQGHIFRQPFYYIDYAIAEAGALQLFELDGRDHAKAMESYLALCHTGGTKSLLDIFKSASLESPFSPKLWEKLMQPIARELGIK